MLIVRVCFVLAAGALTVAGYVLAGNAGRPGATGGSVTYTCPMHPSVRSPAPGDCPICRMRLEPAPSSTNPSEKRSSDGRGDAPRGSEPDNGEPTFSLPASSEFTAFDAVSRAKRYATSLEMRAPAAAEDAGTGSVMLYRDESEELSAGEEGLFSPSSRALTSELAATRVRVTDAPRVTWDRRTVRVPFRVVSGKLVPGETGSVKFATRLRHGLVVKASALIDAPEGPRVLVLSSDRRSVTPRAVTIGNVLYGYAAISAGLREGEDVLCKHVFSVEVARRDALAVAL